MVQDIHSQGVISGAISPPLSGNVFKKNQLSVLSIYIVVLDLAITSSIPKSFLAFITFGLEYKKIKALMN
jgi:hypothetical protein